MQNLSGQAIRGYELRELIGIGGFAAIYRAYQPAVERDVAIKVILAKYANNPNFVRRFESEAQLIARLEHIHIVPLYDYWREPNNAYLVMRWLRGGSLFASVQQGGPWKLRDAARLIDQIASALAIAHRNNIIHRDLTPANILLDEERNAYLADFGIAKDAVVDESAEGDKQLYGSPAYMAPEQIKGEQVSAQTDIYSLGIVIYEMLTGRTPFTAPSIANLMHMHLVDPVPPLQAFRPDLPYAFNVVIMTAVAKNPKVRYSDTLSLAADFRHALQSIDEEAEIEPTITRAESVETMDLKSETLVLGTQTQILEEPPPQNPYKGLRAFDEADALDFFGRTALIGQLLKPLGEPGGRFLAVVGPSGSGKSSVVKAGVLPALRRDALPGSERWFVAKMVPGSQPLQELESALLSVTFDTSNEEVFSHLRSSERGLLETVARILPNDDTPLLLVIDQFEEVFTRTSDEAERAFFLNSLYVAATDPESRLRIIITLRADFYDRPLLYPGFGDLIRAGTEVVLPLTANELQDAIFGPAQRAELTLEPGLVAAIVADVNEQPGALPLLQYALTELFERRVDRTLTLQAYRESGGVLGALARRAEEVTSQMPADQQDIIRQIFLRLVNLGEGTEDTRRRVRWAELVSVGVDQKDVTQRILETFGQYRLLTFDRDPQTREPTVEIAHEALIREWQRLRVWLQENRDDLRVQQRLVGSTAEWIKAGRDSSFLAAGNRLAQFESLMSSASLALTEDEQAYVRASIKLRQRGVQRLWMFIGALVVFSIISLILAGFAFDRQNRAEKAQATTAAERDRADLQARISRSGELAVTALNRINQVDLSLLLSLEALHTVDTFEARDSLVRGLLSNPRLFTMLHDSSSAVRSVVFSPDGLWLAAGNSSGEIFLWDVTARHITAQTIAGHTDAVTSVTFSPDGTLLASASEDGTISLWDAASGESLGNLLDDNGGNPVWSVVFSPDGKLLASSYGETAIRLWDVAAREPRGEPLDGHTDYVMCLAFSPDGKLLASGSADTTVRLWDVETSEAVGEPLTDHSDWIWSLAFSPDGNLLASASGGLSGDNTIRLWDVNAHENFGEPLVGHSAAVRSLAFSPDGTVLLSGSEDNTLRLWDVATGQPVGEPLVGHSENVRSVAYNPNGHTLASGSDDHSVILWDIQGHSLIERELIGNQEEVISVAFSPNGQLFASAGGSQAPGGEDYTVRLWDTQTGTQQALFGKQSWAITAVTFSPDGQTLASASADKTIMLWDIQTGQGNPLVGHEDAIRAAVFSPDGRWLVSGGDDQRIILWDMTTQQPDILSEEPDDVFSLAFSPDGTILASGGADGTISLWNMADQRPLIKPLAGHSDIVTSMAFSPNGQILASASRDSTIILWDMKTYQPIGQPLTGHTRKVLSVRFSPDGRMLASSGEDNAVILWDVTTHQQIGQPLARHTNWVQGLAFSPDGRILVSGGRDTRVVLWKVNLESWTEAACRIANRNLSPQEWARYFGDEPYRATCG
jgi:WD40 repeat protein/serine/threonine protein kinase